jgi:hypothetical protein
MARLWRYGGMARFSFGRLRVQEELALLRQLGRVRRLASLKKSLEQYAIPAEHVSLPEFQSDQFEGNKGSLGQRGGAVFVPGK